MGWAKNGMPAGVTGGQGNNIEAIEIRLVNKGFNGPEESGQPFRDISSKEDPAPLSVSISSHVGMVGWQPAVTDEMVSGTVSQNHPIEAVKKRLYVSDSHVIRVGKNKIVNNISCTPIIGGYCF